METKKLSKVLQISVLAGLLFTQFNNCAFSPQTNPEGSDSVNCLNASCIEPNPTNMTIQANVGAAGAYLVNSTVPEFNIGGDCNEAGFPVNSIHWQLIQQTASGPQEVRNSEMQVTSSGPAVSSCVNGRFMIYVNLQYIPQDPVTRTGLLTQSNGRQNYTLNIYIYGQNSPSDPGPQFAEAQTTVPLGAI